MDEQSGEAFIFDVSDAWDARNILYSLPFNRRNTVYDDVTALCNMFFPKELRDRMHALHESDEAKCLTCDVDFDRKSNSNDGNWDDEE
ncbi:Uu.00g009730.m01.CDS01 [Anthostomella pinea]|uniref:Uu.00g009730.m01.CDS01 n=1 Tax=Anthostomella pinea TaxID=933095 RepID=A0AAI8VY38_9PEZI|nr:Uu.00g009730.m01.CDS01 [Anthostomella pinea]